MLDKNTAQHLKTSGWYQVNFLVPNPSGKKLMYREVRHCSSHGIPFNSALILFSPEHANTYLQTYIYTANCRSACCLKLKAGYCSF
jgi:hypothetical protein